MLGEYCFWSSLPTAYVSYSLDAVQDLIDHPTFESEFTNVAKGLPDLERIVSRIHAKNCRVKDFLKVLEVCFVQIALVNVIPSHLPAL